jgi:hypothetical protein
VRNCLPSTTKTFCVILSSYPNPPSFPIILLYPVRFASPFAGSHNLSMDAFP